jgi:D-tyrosyl-tRNA(Tyr) deacylase
MRAVVQRVERAEVRVHEDSGVRVAGVIGRGLVVLLGVEVRDTEADAAWMAAKIAGLRVFEDEGGKMNLGLAEVGGGVVLVPNFTVAGSAAKGRRPDFGNAMRPPEAERLFGRVAELIRDAEIRVETGVFGGDMRVELVNDGPVTLVVESPAPHAPA